MGQSDFCASVDLTPFARLRSVLLLLQRYTDLPGTLELPRILATPLDPGGTLTFSRYRMLIAVCGKRKYIDFHSLLLTGLISFTLSHCGSYAPLPTLKPCLAALAPRLSTGCSLNFTRVGISPTYISSAELAHSFLGTLICASAALSLLCKLLSMAFKTLPFLHGMSLSPVNLLPGNDK